MVVGGEVALTVDVECVERTDWAEEVVLVSIGIVLVCVFDNMGLGLKNVKDEEEEGF